ncbi:hypothetical protein BSY17_4129 (plasmid) [Sphingobium sp. RAC03]|nr:hypothetical protein BSY17_4129 [Sphingobium sp. RAC03]
MLLLGFVRKCGFAPARLTEWAFSICPLSAMRIAVSSGVNPLFPCSLTAVMFPLESALEPDSEVRQI